MPDHRSQTASGQLATPAERALVSRLVIAGDLEVVHMDREGVTLLAITEQGRARLTGRPGTGTRGRATPAAEVGAGPAGADPVAAYHERVQRLHDERNRLKGKR